MQKKMKKKKEKKRICGLFCLKLHKVLMKKLGLLNLKATQHRISTLISFM